MNCRLCDLPLVEGTSSYDAGRHLSVHDCKRALMDRVVRLEAVRVAAENMGAVYHMPISDPLRQALAALSSGEAGQGQDQSEPD